MQKIFRSKTPPAPTPGVSGLAVDWRLELPRLSNAVVELREPAVSDAASLLTAIGVVDLVHVPELAASTLASLEAFLRDLPQRRASGLAACWAVQPAGAAGPVGLILFRGLDPAFATVEASAVIAAEYRGTGLFAASSHLMLQCLFEAMQVHRIEARVETRLGRANGALRKVGASQEGVLRQVLANDGRHRDHVLWAMVAQDWIHRTAPGAFDVH